LGDSKRRRDLKVACKAIHIQGPGGSEMPRKDFPNLRSVVKTCHVYHKVSIIFVVYELNHPRRLLSLLHLGPKG
jgi:hypothetical protein